MVFFAVTDPPRGEVEVLATERQGQFSAIRALPVSDILQAYGSVFGFHMNWGKLVFTAWGRSTGCPAWSDPSLPLQRRAPGHSHGENHPNQVHFTNGHKLFLPHSYRVLWVL